MDGPAPIRLRAGISYQGHLAGGGRLDFFLHLEQGQFLHAIAEQRELDIKVLVTDPHGRYVLQLDSPTGRSGAEQVFLWAEESGEYRIELVALEPPAGGGYLFRVAELRPGTREDRKAAQAARLIAEAEELRRRGKFAEALNSFEAAAAVYRELGDFTGEARACGRKSAVLSRLGRAAEALEVSERATKLASKEGDRALEGRLLADLGRILVRLGRNGAGEAALRQALELHRAVHDLRGEAGVQNELAALAARRGLLGEAERRYLGSLAHYKQVGDARSQAILLANLAGVYLSAGEGDLALAYCTQAEDILPQPASQGDRAFLREQTAEAHRRNNHPEKALAAYREALQLYRQAGDLPAETRILQGIARLHYDTGNYRQARIAYESLVERARTGFDSHLETTVLQDLAWVHFKLGETAAALDLFRHVLPQARRFEDPWTEAATLKGMAVAEASRGGLKEARLHAEQALERVETLRGSSGWLDLKTSYFSRKSHFFDLAVDLLLQRTPGPDPGQSAIRAFEMSERARARRLLDLLSESAKGTEQQAPSVLLGRFQAQVRAADARVQQARASGEANAVAQAERQLLTALAELRRLEGAGAATRSRRALLPRFTTAKVEEIQREVLDGRTVLLAYDLGEERSYVWAVWQGGIEAFPLPPAAVIEEAAEATYGLLAASNETGASLRVKQAATALGELILGPVAADLQRGDRLLVLPEGALDAIPFGALPMPRAAGGTGEPLLATHEIVYTPSASVALWIRREHARRRLPEKMLAVIADPVFGPDDPRLTGAGRKPEPSIIAARRDATGGASSRALEKPLARLPFSGQEAQAALRLVPPSERLSALGFAASKDLVLSGALANYRLVHFATHSMIRNDHPELSGIALARLDAGGHPRDGDLRVLDLAGLDFPADLVVLSGCRTALGKEIPGEGLVGLSHAFFAAGAARVLVSLWPVDDQAAAQLMSQFYEGLLRQGLPPAAALRRAQLSLRSQPRWSRPYFWAGFVLQGQG